MKRQQNDLGFTLLELMIAIGISLIVMTGVMGIFSSNSQSYLLQEDIATMQENLRSAAVIMQREIQMAGAGMPGIDGPGGFNVTKLIAGIIKQQRAYPLTFQNNAGDLLGLTADPNTGLFPAGVGGYDRLIVRYNRMVEGSCGPVPQGITLKACDALPKITLQEKMPSNSPEAKILEPLAYNNNAVFPCNDANNPTCYSMFPQWDNGCWCGNSYPAPKMGFMAIITSPDGSQADIFQIDGVQGWSGANPPGASNKIQQKMKLANDYPNSSKITFFSMKTYREVMFYVQENNLRQRVTIFNDPTPAGDILAPTITDQPIAENIEDLQFAFLLDSDRDGTLDTTWITGGDLTNDQSLLVRLVRINVLGRTSNPGNSFATHVSQAIGMGTGTSAASLEDHPASAIEAQEPLHQAGRYYSRKLIQTTVKVRALGL